MRSLIATLFAGLGSLILFGPDASCQPTRNVSGCELLANPAVYNGKLVTIEGRVHSDFEHFDLRFNCKGYIELETSERDADAQKFGFKTKMDSKYQKFMKAVENPQAVGKDRLQCTENKNKVFIRVRGRFRCHQDFPDCSKISRYGDSSLVIMKIESLKVERQSQGKVAQ